MRQLGRKEYMQLVREVEAAQGELYPPVQELPYAIRVELLLQAREEGVEIGDKAVAAQLEGLDARVALMRRVARLIGGGSR